MDHGAFPGEAAAAAMSIRDDAGKYTEAVIVAPGTGVITIHLREDAVPGDGRIFLEPKVQADYAIKWVCTSTLAAKHVPAACRGGE
jgi:hypothetical protein